MADVAEAFWRVLIERRIATFLRKMGHRGRNKIELVLADNPDGLIAGARGVADPMPKGMILLDKRLTDAVVQGTLSCDAFNFILAHEVAHIVHSDGVVEDTWRRLKKSTGNDWAGAGLEALELAFEAYNYYQHVRLRERSFKSRYVMLKEIRADLAAVRATGVRGSARAALEWLSRGNLQATSHTWDMFDKEPEVMTIQERIDIIEANLDAA